MRLTLRPPFGKPKAVHFLTWGYVGLPGECLWGARMVGGNNWASQPQWLHFSGFLKISHKARLYDSN